MESLKEAVIIGFGIILLLYCFLHKVKGKGGKLKFPPAPTSLPLIGCLHVLGNLPHQSLATLARKYGPIMFLRLGSVPTVVVSSPAMAKEFLKIHDLVFASRRNCSLGRYMCYDHKGLASSPYGEYWRQMRKLCTVELFTAKRTESFRSVREEEVAAMVASISKESGQCVDVRKRLSSLTQNITCRMFASRTFSDNDLDGGLGFKQLVEEMTSVSGAFPIGDLIPTLNWLDWRGIRGRMKAVHKIFDGFAENVIDEHVHRRLGKEKLEEQDRVKDLVDVMLDIAETEGETISRTHIKAIIMDIIVAGMETSATLVEWALSELLKNPSTLAQAQEEIECVVGRNRRVKESDVMKLEYLRCVVKETFRLHPPVPLLLPHESTDGCSVGGYFVPPKTQLFVNVWAIGRDEDVWEDALQFKPERFLGSNKDVRGQDFDLLPFGAGRRGCPGVPMGLSVSELALAQLIHCFDWTVEGEIDMAEECRMSVPRKNPLFAGSSWRLTSEYPV